jgi:hypothetical protein
MEQRRSYFAGRMSPHLKAKWSFHLQVNAAVQMLEVQIQWEGGSRTLRVCLFGLWLLQKLL